MSPTDPYLFPGLPVLRNKLGIRLEAELEHVERLFVAQRAIEGIPHGVFDLAHLKAIHRHLFQDIYDWAGEIRTVELNKGGQQFQFRQYIETGMADIHQRLAATAFLKDLDANSFAIKAAVIMGDINYVHPFREGNGRAQLFYLEQLAVRAGHPLDLARIDPNRWIEASRRSHGGDYSLMAAEIELIREI